MLFGTTSELGPRNIVLRVGDDPQRERGNFGGKHVPDKPNTPMNFELDWSMQRRAHDGGRHLITSAERVYYQPRRVGLDCIPRAKSDIYDCVVLEMCPKKQSYVETLCVHFGNNSLVF